jgi:hypothetical protein
MTQKFNRIAIPILFMFAITMIVGGAGALTPDAGTEAASSTVTESNVLAEATVDKTANEAANVAIPRTRPTVATVATNPWHNYTNVCETFTVTEGTKKVKNRNGQMVWPTRHRRNRYNRKKSDQRRTRELVKMVVKEMGGDDDAQRIVSMIAMHESSWNPEAIHILNPDLSANQAAWQRHSYNRSNELAIEARMNAASQKSNKDGYYGLKARLSDIRLYKGNPHWDDQLEYMYKIPEREHRGEKYPASEWKESRSVWAFGYGLYGMNAVLFTHLWDRQAPPWILCADEGIEATVAAVWVLRRNQIECDNLSKQNPEKYGVEGGSAEGVVRRFGRGKCSDKRLGKAWRKLMAQIDIDWDASPNFGTKFTRYQRHMRGGKWRWTKDENKKRIPADRQEVLAHMRKKAAEKGLLRTTPLVRKNPDSAPVVVARGLKTVPVESD